MHWVNIDGIAYQEVIINIAIATTKKLLSRPLPLKRIRVASHKIARDLTTAKVPDIDILSSPLHDINPSSSLVEAITIARGPTGLYTTALIAFAILVDKCAARTSMHGHGVLALIAYTLDDVDLAAVGPVWPSHPEGRPDATGCARHMLEIESNEAVCILLFACNADGVAAPSGCYIGTIGPDGDLATIDADKAGTLSSALVYVVDVAVSGIIFLSLC